MVGGYISPTKLAVWKTVGLDDSKFLVADSFLADVEKDGDDAASHEAGHHACECACEQDTEKHRIVVSCLHVAVPGH